jgi:predicted kinase
VSKPKAAVAALIGLTLIGCSREGEITSTGVITTYTACPTVAIAAPTGDVTLFDPPQSRDSAAIDVVATMTNVRSSCNEAGENIVTSATFDIQARRRDRGPARDVILPYYASVVQGGQNVVSKSVTNLVLRFAEGQDRASASGTATSQVQRAAATLPEDIRRQVVRERRAGDADAAVDPFSDPAVRAAVQRASFEVLIGFQLSEDQLRYNATR